MPTKGQDLGSIEEKIQSLLQRQDARYEMPLDAYAKELQGSDRMARYTEFVGAGDDYVMTFYLANQLPVEDRSRIHWQTIGNALAALGNDIAGDGDAPGLAPADRSAICAIAAKGLAEVADYGNFAAYDDLISLGAIEHGTYESAGRLPSLGHQVLELNLQLDQAPTNSAAALDLSNRIADLSKTSDLAMFRLTKALENHSGARPEPMNLEVARRGVAEAIGARLEAAGVEDAVKALSVSVFGRGGATLVGDSFHGLPLLGTAVYPKATWREVPHPEGAAAQRIDKARELYSTAGILALDDDLLHSLALEPVDIRSRGTDTVFPDDTRSVGSLVALDAALTTFEDRRVSFAVSQGLLVGASELDEDHGYARAIWTLFQASSQGNSAMSTEILMKHLQTAANQGIHWNPAKTAKSWDPSRW